jgi:hypothetical protein
MELLWRSSEAGKAINQSGTNLSFMCYQINHIKARMADQVISLSFAKRSIVAHTLYAHARISNYVGFLLKSFPVSSEPRVTEDCYPMLCNHVHYFFTCGLKIQLKLLHILHKICSIRLLYLICFWKHDQIYVGFMISRTIYSPAFLTGNQVLAKIAANTGELITHFWVGTAGIQWLPSLMIQLF